MTTEKRIITHKDADQNLCTIAAYILSEAMKIIRSSRDVSPTGWVATPDGQQIADPSSYPVEGGGTVEAGFLEGADSKRVWWSGDDIWNHYLDSAAGIVQTPQCWWCFQNIVKMRLAEARQNLEDALYRQDKAVKVDQAPERSRNRKKRERESKYGRTPERR